MTFDTRIAVVLRDDVAVWQKLNMTAFLVSGIAATVEEVVGEPYEDGSGNQYLPMFKQPVVVFQATEEQMQTVYQRAMGLETKFSLFTQDLFATGNDIDNRAAVKAVAQGDLVIVGMAFRDTKKRIDKIVKGLALHR